MDFFKTAWNWVSGSSVTSTLARLAILGYSSRLLTKALEKENNKPDKGVRLQLNPSSDNVIPILYGKAYFGGNITDAQISSDFKKMTYCLTIAEVTGNLLSSSSATAYTFEGVYFNGNSVVFKSDGVTVDYTLDPDGNQDISARDLIKVYFYKGQTPIQPYGYSGTTPASYSVMPGWTAETHPMTNLLYAIVEVTYNQKQNINSLPDCTWHITSTMNKPGDVLYDYMVSTRYGAGLTSAEIDTASLTALNSYAATGFTYTDTEANSVTSSITINGVVDTNQTLLSNMSAIADNTGSWLTYDIYTGKWTVILNKTETAVVTLTDSNILGEISISGTSLTQLDNVVNVQYQNTDVRDKTDYVKIALPEEDLHPNEPVKTLQLNLPFINKQVVAAKIGLQQLKQARVDKIIKFTTDFSYLQLKAGEVIGITNSVYGFTSKLFRIIDVRETENAAGDLNIEFTCLEYESDVYDYDITEYAVESNNGILGIGSIGQANTPTVTKQEISNIPSILITAEVPSGIVSALEFWQTYDVSVLNDSARTYVRVGLFENPDGSLLTEDDVIEYTCSGLATGNFLIKVRGVNAFKSGPYSSPTGVINYVPDVVANSIDIDAEIRNSTYGLIGLLTAGQLLGKVNDLLGGDEGKSLLDSVLDYLWPDRTSNKTAAELLQEDTQFLSELGGTINDLNNISIDELQDVDTTTVAPTVNDKLTWDGSNWVPSGATDAGAAIVAWARLTAFDGEILVDSSFNIDTEVEQVFLDQTRDYKIKFTTAQPGNAYVVLTSVGNASTYQAGETAPSNSQIFTSYNHTTNDFILRSDSSLGSGSIIYIAVVGTTGIAGGVDLLTISSRTPSDRATHANPLTASTASDEVGIVDETTNAAGQVDVDAPIKITYSVSDVYSLSKGSGTARLYKSNGTLVASLPASNLVIVGNQVTLPFGDREYGHDYYVLMDRGMVTGQGENKTYYSPSIGRPTFWNFHTKSAADPATVEQPRPGQSTVNEPPSFKPVPLTCTNLTYLNFITQSKYSDQTHLKVHRQSLIKLVFNNPIQLGTSGTITIASSGGTFQQFNIAHSFKTNKISELLWIDEDNDKILVVNPTKDFTPGTTYWLTITANCVYDKCRINGNVAILDTSKIRWTVDPGPVSKTTSL